MLSGTDEVLCRCAERGAAVSRTFPGHSDRVAAARQFVRESLGGQPCTADAVLLTSELATNAVLHTASGDGGSFVVAVHRVPAFVRVEVTDGGSPGVPTVAGAPGARLAPSGRGLLLVERVAARWGYRGGPDSRVVWCELDRS
ncbi:MAG TPA: ATP-binding protein [Streptosporangiaceae bacterium]|nr:ATP-binding protein [Streptosporangiaceae bacterium]